MSTQIALNDIISFLGSQVKAIYGEPAGKVISYLKDPQNVDEYTLDWVNPHKENKQAIVENSKAKAIIVDEGIQFNDKLIQQGKVLIVVNNPKLALSKIGNHFFLEKIEPEIHPTAVIHPDAQIGINVFIGANASIGKCKIGNNVHIYQNTVLCDGVVLNDDVKIHANASIGVDGLGCEREKDGSLVKFPHLGGVIIENNVEIGAACIIAKGALSNTVIGQGTKINVGCFIAHNGNIGRNVWLSPKVNIAGSIKIEDNVTIFSGAIIREQRLIGEGAVIGMGAVVTKNIPPGETWVGNPARKIEK